MKSTASSDWQGDPRPDIYAIRTESVTSTFATLSRTAPFDRLSRYQLHALIDNCSTFHFRRGEVVTHGHRLTRHLWLVLDGKVKCSLLSPTGAEKIMQIASPGTMVGEEAALLRRPQLCYAQTLCDSTLLRIRADALHTAIAESPSFSKAMTLRLSAAIYALLEDVQLCLQSSGTQRVAHYLIHLANHSVDCCEVQLETTKQNIAAQLNLTPETFSRILSNLARDGMIRTLGGRRLMLEKLSLLRRCAAGQYEPSLPFTSIRPVGRDGVRNVRRQIDADRGLDGD